MRKYARIIVRGHYLFRKSKSFERAELEENFNLRGTYNIQGQISKRFFKSNGGYSVNYPPNIFRNTRGLLVCHMSMTSKVVNWLPKSHLLSIHFETFEQTSLQLKEYALGKVQYFSKRKRGFFNSVKNLKLGNITWEYSLGYSPVLAEVYSVTWRV